ncbi:MAG TPA: M56 family metallopeptidase [Candidatus Polarisedimenticolia bacterium]|nr:M56 family metallopeptidase [Candidatus Polarisedimenticolia bacterium]
MSSGLVSGNRISFSLNLAPKASASGANNPAGPQLSASTEASRNERATRTFTTRVNRNWLAVALVVWGGGIALMLIYSSLGIFHLRKISRNARRLEEGDWMVLLNEARAVLGLRQRVILLQSRENLMPFTWGWLPPKIMMPAEANQWPTERRRIVLLHELAHVKRRDCLAQSIARLICAAYWMNPLAWLAARRMCIERERACDDLVLNGGCKASDYASELVQIASAFRRVTQAAGIAMARNSNLEQRVTAIVDPSRARRLRPMGLVGVLTLIAAVIFYIGSYKVSFGSDDSPTLRQQQLAQLEQFSAEKEKQALLFAAASGDEILPFFQKYFDAAKSGDYQAVVNGFDDFKKYHPQYAKNPRYAYRTSFWQQMLEIGLGYDHFAHCEPKYTQIAVDGIVNSIPPGSIYFGGTDPGRGLPTVFSKSQIDAEPFYTLTQNALADSTYLQYLRFTYGNDRLSLGKLVAAIRADPELLALQAQFRNAQRRALLLETTRPDNDPERKSADQTFNDLMEKIPDRINKILEKLRTEEGSNPPSSGPKAIYIPSNEEQQQCFTNYSEDAKARFQHDQKFPHEPRQIKPGEDFHVDAEQHIQVSGQIAVMAINARVAKIIFDRNPDREFYLEESFPLDWMYPHLEPHGFIMKINREPLAEGLPDDVVQKDHDFWQKQANQMIGNWLTEDTSVKTVADFAEKIYARKDLSGFTGDPAFIHDDYAPKMFSKWRSAIGGLYCWRTGVSPNNDQTPSQYLPKSDAERQRMTSEADFAFKQAVALCPTSPEAVYRYVNFLLVNHRKEDALLIAQAAAQIEPENANFKYLVRDLSK